MAHKKLLGFYAFFEVCLLVAGIIALVFSIVWRKPDPVLNMVFSNGDLLAGTILGVALLVTFATGIGAIVQANHVTIGLVIFNWMLFADAIITLVIGTFVWYNTLRERVEFQQLFEAQPTANQIAIQGFFQCCGYFATNQTVTIGGFCSSADFATQHNTTCVGPITDFADESLNNVFTSVYGFMAVIIVTFMASMCVIKVRQTEERFIKIDAKRGGRGFV